MPSEPGGLRYERVVVPTPYAVGPANVYVFPSEPVTLFDCGPNTPATERALRDGLAAVGLSFERIRRIVVSHGHPDHYGLAPSIQERSGAEVLIGRDDAAKLADRSMLLATGKLLLRAGMPVSTLLEMGERDRGSEALRPEVLGARPLDEGDRVGFEDGLELEVLHLPGHTAGHVCLWHPASGVLFAGDTLLLEISPNPLLEPDPKDPSERRRSLVEYLATLDRLSSLAPGRVLPGHGPPIEHPLALIEEMREHHDRRIERLWSMLGEEPRSGWQLAVELFPSLEGFDNFLAVSEVVAHMDLLVDQGRAQPEERDGVTYYRRGRRT